jgi:hypothetical protein
MNKLLTTVDVCQSHSLYIHALVRVTAYTLESLDTSSAVTKTTADDHANSVSVVCCAEVEASDAVIVVEKVDRVKAIFLHVHAAKFFVRSVFIDTG